MSSMRFIAPCRSPACPFWAWVPTPIPHHGLLEAAEYEAVSCADAPQMVAGLTAPQSTVTGNYLHRMTITGAMLALSRKAFLIIKGDSKIALLEDCLSSPSPASLIARAAAILGARLQIFALRGTANARRYCKKSPPASSRAQRRHGSPIWTALPRRAICRKAATRCRRAIRRIFCAVRRMTKKPRSAVTGRTLPLSAPIMTCCRRTSPIIVIPI